MPIKVSVVVPVYNPGHHIDGLIASLRRQSLPAHEFEAIFVDDGSTDGTGEMLDRLALEVANFRVIHIPNSGWPGKPRNVGMDAARGEYVQFVDNDDELGDQALARMYDYAAENGSDVLVGKEVRRNIRVGVVPMFTRNRPKATLENDPLLVYLTPHKMFRRSFLNDVPLRFPEGPRRLEDHPFVMTAYFRAEVVSVLSDYPCYFWITRVDKSNAGLRPRVWADWFGHMRDVLDVVAEYTEPGPFRDRLLSHWYRTKGLNLLGAGLANRPSDDVRELFEAFRDLALERYPVSVDDHLTGVMAVRSRLLRAGDLDTLRALAEAESGMRVEQRLDSFRWHDGALHIRVSAWLTYADGAPVEVEVDGDRLVWQPPVPLGVEVTRDVLDFAVRAAQHPVEVVIRSRSTFAVYPLPGETEALPERPDGTRLVGATRSVRLDPETAEEAGPLTDGVWDVDVLVGTCGWTVRDYLRTPEPRPKTPLLPVRTDRMVAPYANAAGRISIDVGQRLRPLLKDVGVDLGAAAVRGTSGGMRLELPLRGLRLLGRPVPVRLRLKPTKGKPIVVRGRLVGKGERGIAHLVAKVPAAAWSGLVPGRWQLRVRHGRWSTDLGLELGRYRWGLTTLRRPGQGAGMVLLPRSLARLQRALARLPLASRALRLGERAARRAVRGARRLRR